MSKVAFNYHSKRSRQARLAHHLSPALVYWTLATLGLLTVASGLFVAVYWGIDYGYALAGLAGVFWVLAGYGRGLRKLPANKEVHAIDDVLDADILGRLSEHSSPSKLLDLALHTVGGRFLVARLGLGQILATISDDPADSPAVWREAMAFREQAQDPGLSGASLVAAIVRTMPQPESNLATIRLGDDSLVDGVRWFLHEKALFEHQKERRHNGGLARDWSFGFTPLLGRFGINLSDRNHGLIGHIPSREQMIKHILQSLSEGTHRNVALVGQLGSGKTSLVQAVARLLLNPDHSVPANLQYRQVIALEPATLMAQARDRGELEALVEGLAAEAIKAKNVVLFLDDAQLFFEEGTGRVNLTHILTPYLQGGALKLVLAMDEQRWTQISEANPALGQLLNRLSVPPMSKPETLLAMQDKLPQIEAEHHVSYSLQSLNAAFRLSDRFMSDQAMPGKAITLLESAAAYGEDHFVTEKSVSDAIEQVHGVKVGAVDSGAERQTLMNLEQLIHNRMVNQTRAVQVVSEALRRARAGVSNTKKPIGTFLFLGPTGVGKTELAKSVAAVFFGGEDRLIRIDLNSFVRPEDVSRLIADPAQDPHSLTAQISHQPFSVVLFDEIEKAHPDVLGTLLQMLDEGVLRDASNRQVSFRDAVIIATSNAGAGKIREHIQKGEALELFEEQFVDELIDANIFKPELLNRFDEIVLFRPLTDPELLQVVDIILKGVNANLTAQKVSVTVDEEGQKLLVAAGHDQRLGARPLRRVVQRVVENIVANRLLAQQVQPGSRIDITAQEVQTMLDSHK